MTTMPEATTAPPAYEGDGWGGAIVEDERRHRSSFEIG